MVVKTLRHGFVDYLRKPILGDDLLHRLNRACEILDLRRQRLQAEEELQRAQRLIGIAQLAGGVAHNFNNILAVIQWKLEVLQETMPSRSEQSILVDEIFLKMGQAAKINGGLLAFTGQKFFRPRILDLRDVMKSIAEKIRQDTDSVVEIELRLDDIPAPVSVDSENLEFAVNELVQNAVSAKPRDNLVTLKVAVISQDKIGSSYDVPWTDGGAVLLSVIDHGKGMSEDVAKRAM